MDTKYGKVPDHLFIKAEMVRDIRFAKILPPKERKSGEPDVVMESPLGFSKRITRRELVRTYTYRDGSKISLGRWKNNTFVPVISPENRSVYVGYVPRKYAGEHDIYLVRGYENDSDQNLLEIRPELFRKMFRKNGNTVFEEAGVKKKTNEGCRNEGITKRSEPDDGMKYRDMSSRNDSSAEYVAVARISQDRDTVGLVLKDLQGTEQFYTNGDVVSLQERGLISNVGVRQRNGKKYIYGIGCRLSGLPEINSRFVK